ncbi:MULTISPECIES: sodium:calcium antiporter [Halobacteriales]|jgi:cation:H+ antiporter|uniref:sodium:calcium antiporter n=1 Tax=Halobacteriales TaxID=2235 RepID=UPI0018CD6C35|nr:MULTISPECIES: sodium:calcium exchanger [Halobacteria]MDT3436895.1 hypothetical protein [Haloarcula sp. 1CSR25-25]
MVQLSPWLWAVILVVGVFAAHWGAEQLSHPIKKLRRQLGLTAVAGGALVGIAAAGSEIGINVTSAYRGVSDIGLGMMLGSNIVSIPLIVTIAYVASRKRDLGGGTEGQDTRRDGGQGSTSSGGQTATHGRHRQENLLRIQKEAVTVLILPYLGILGLVAVLTLPESGRGLQPIDGWIMGAAYLAYLGQAFFRGRSESEDVQWAKKELGLAGAGLVVLASGAYGIVLSTENIVAALGISRLVGGLFVTAIVTAIPEMFATWSVVRSGQVTAGTTSVIGDNAVTMTVAFVPLALVTVPIEDFQLYWVNLLFVALMPAVYAGLTHWGAAEHGFTRLQVLLFDGLYVVYVGVMAFSVLNIL